MKIRRPQLEPRSLRPHVLVPTGHIFWEKNTFLLKKPMKPTCFWKKKDPELSMTHRPELERGSWTFFSVTFIATASSPGWEIQAMEWSIRNVCERHLKRHMKNRGESREKVGKKSGWEKKKWRQRTARTMQKWADKGKEQRSKTENPSWQKQTFLISYRKVVPLQNPISNGRKEVTEKEWITCIEVQVP